MPRQPDIRVYHGDCLPILQKMGDATVDLVYIDPPFCSQKVHRLQPRDRSREFSFADLWSTQRDYGKFLSDRLVEAHRLLSDRGSLFFHCDRNASHLARLILDDLFGPDRFRAEIIWHYRRWSNAGPRLLPAHQTILYYTRTDTYTFHQSWTEYSPATNIDQTLQRRGRDGANKSVYRRDQYGEPVPDGRKRGVPLGDVWDIPFLNPKAKERTGYPTQKPLLLLERIITLASNEGDCVLDPFCGSGTTLVAARLLGRNAIGIDLSSDAIELTRKRLEHPTRSESRLLKSGRESYRNADARALALLQGLDYVPVHRNAGIDAILSEGAQGCPVTIRVQRPDETILEAAHKLHRALAAKGAKLMFLVATTRRRDPENTAELPAGVVIVESAALGIRGCLERLIATRDAPP